MDLDNKSEEIKKYCMLTQTFTRVYVRVSFTRARSVRVDDTRLCVSACACQLSLTDVQKKVNS